LRLGHPHGLGLPRRLGLHLPEILGRALRRALGGRTLRQAQGELGLDARELGERRGATVVLTDEAFGRLKVFLGEPKVEPCIRVFGSARLSHEAGALLAATPQSGTPTPSAAKLENGQIEQSNTSVVGAMTDLVSASRTFEAFQRVIDTFRDTDRSTVTTIPSVQ
jgi:hypothetical protein